MKLKLVVSYYLPVVLWAFAIFLVSAQSSLPSPEVATLDFLIKKTGHMVVYGVLYFLIFRAWLKSTHDSNRSQKALLIGPFILCLLYAISDEVHQSFVPGRFPSARDVGFDMLGSGLVFLKLYGYL